MSIAVLMYTVVTRLDEIKNKYPGGLREYASLPFVWYDEFLVGSSFMNGFDVDDHINCLRKCGIYLDALKSSQSVAVVDQIRGILTECDWLDFGKDVSGQEICWLRGKMPGPIVMPKELSDTANRQVIWTKYGH